MILWYGGLFWFIGVVSPLNALGRKFKLKRFLNTEAFEY